MKKLMIYIAILSILAASQAQAVVEDSGNAPGDDYAAGDSWSSPASPSMPTYLPSPCYGDSGRLKVGISQSGPESERDKAYITQGSTLGFMVSVENEGDTEVEADLSINPRGCPFEWFNWATETLTIPAGGSRSLPLQITPDVNAAAGKYEFEVEATGSCRKPGKETSQFVVQAMDYASEIYVSGTGDVQISKNLKSMNSGIRSSKDVSFNGEVDQLEKNEYLVVGAKGRNPNFWEEDKVDNYTAVTSNLIGTERFKSSAVFGGVGARVIEQYNVWEMESKDQDFTLHQTGSLKKTAEFQTKDEFNGTYIIDAKQSIPGQQNLKEFERYVGAFEIKRRIVFRDQTNPSTAPCQEGDCPGISMPKKPAPCQKGDCHDVYIPRKLAPKRVVSPCQSISCHSFTDSLNGFGK
jgi:hypothetical protein